MTENYRLRPTPEEFVAMSPEEIRNHIAVGMIPPELSDEQLRELPATALESYIYAREASGDTGIVGRVTAMLSAGAESQSLLEERRRELSAHDIQYRDGLPPSNSDYRGVNHQKLKADVEPISAEGITVYSDGYHKLHQLFQDLSDQLNTSVNKSKQGWEGGAADNAHGYFTSLATWSEGNSRNAQMASEIVYAESEAATRARDSMPEPIPFNMEQEMDNWDGNPFTFHEQVEQTVKKQQESQAAHDEAARVMTQYDFELQEAGNKQPVFAEPPKFNGAGGSGDTSASGVISISDPSTSASGFAGGVAGFPSGGSVSVPSGGGSGAGPSGGGSFTPVAPGLSTGAGPRPGATRPSGLQPNGWRPPGTGGRDNSRNTFGPGGGPGIGPMPMGPAGGFGPGGGGGGSYGGRFSAGGFGPGGGGAAAPGAGPGAATGAKPMGGPVAAGPGAAAPGAAGAARGAGMAGAPMGAGGGKGQGSEDSEHQRPTYLVEADPDDVFGTNQRTAPPVIGA